MPTLPSALKPTATFSVASPAGAFATQLDGGPDRTGLFFESSVQTFSVTFLLTAQQFSIWELFYKRIVALGTIPFDMPLDSGFGVSAHSCTIVPDSYNGTRNGVLWAVTFQVRAKAQAYDYTPAEAQALLELYELVGDDLAATVDGLYRLANVDSTVLDF